jgi:hypothetical protein
MPCFGPEVYGCHGFAARGADIQAKHRETPMPKIRKAKRRAKAPSGKSSIRKKSIRKRSAHKKSANEMAGIRIDEFEDTSASAAEKVRRKRRLLEGPEEFRDIRSDQRKK